VILLGGLLFDVSYQLLKNRAVRATEKDCQAKTNLSHVCQEAGIAFAEQ
jgi:hypothetical protein